MAASSHAATVGSELPPEPGGSGGPGERADEQRELLLARLVPASRLKEAVGASLASLCLGPLGGAQRLGTLVDCLVLNYRLRQGPGRGRERGAEGPLRCCGCGRFLGEPVTVPCGHTYCRRCLRRELRARCRRCRDRLLPAGGTSPAAAPLRTSVVLNRLAEKWFPGECERARAGTRLEELLAQGRFREALGAVNQALRAGKAGGSAPVSARAAAALSRRDRHRLAARDGGGVVEYVNEPLSCPSVRDRQRSTRAGEERLEFSGV